ncbi:MAG: bifunctional hydroxymethylpyrimidine kinase/phosphomethylpyrimidine kinase [Desulfuromonadales bacterium]|nr:bifunctional hydroxymethylpyrimidine kinase/phosphomethylpyrimidine kinase [Desulfuromonadales bacterium]
MQKINGLYLITNEQRGTALLSTVARALKSGVRVLQYRPKHIPAAEKRSTAHSLRKLCTEQQVIFIINDDPALAHEVDADGVHLGQQDGSIAEARQLLGPGKIIGRSTRDAAMALAAEAEGADYIGFGSIYATGTKTDAVQVGPDGLRQVRQAVALPLVAIGGIDASGIDAVIDAGADAAAVVSAVMSDPQPQLAAAELALRFNRRLPFPRGRVLTIAGSDSGGGAGIQADLKTVTLLGSYGMSALTALTAQNTLGVHGIYPVPPSFVAAQIDAVVDDIGVDVIKTGMLHSAELVALVADQLEQRGLLAVVDPVMIAKGGSALLNDNAIATVRDQLLPQAYLLTPNIPEAEALSGRRIVSEADMLAAAIDLRRLGARHVLLKGGHLAGDPVDLLLTAAGLTRLPGERIVTRNTHGTGCSYAAAIATLLAQGQSLPQAVQQAKHFIHRAISTARPLGVGHGPVNHYQAAREL